MNTSAAKTNVLGGCHGLSERSSAKKTSVERVLHGKDTMSHSYAAVERPETM